MNPAIEYLIFTDPDNERPSVTSPTREGAELWATRFQNRTGKKVKLVRRTWSYDDVEVEVRERVV